MYVCMYVGMRPEFWVAFQEKYHVKRIVEFYAATEGNAFLVNCFDKVDLYTALNMYLCMYVCVSCLQHITLVYGMRVSKSFSSFGIRTLLKSSYSSKPLLLHLCGCGEGWRVRSPSLFRTSVASDCYSTGQSYRYDKAFKRRKWTLRQGHAKRFVTTPYIYAI